MKTVWSTMSAAVVEDGRKASLKNIIRASTSLSRLKNFTMIACTVSLAIRT